MRIWQQHNASLFAVRQLQFYIKFYVQLIKVSGTNRLLLVILAEKFLGRSRRAVF